MLLLLEGLWFRFLSPDLLPTVAAHVSQNIKEFIGIVLIHEAVYKAHVEYVLTLKLV